METDKWSTEPIQEQTISDFEKFCTFLEKQLILNYRQIYREYVSSINTVALTKNILKGKDKESWEVSFAVRVNTQWYQCTETLDPIVYDMYDPPPPDEVEGNVSLQDKATEIAVYLIDEVGKSAGWL